MRLTLAIGFVIATSLSANPPDVKAQPAPKDAQTGIATDKVKKPAPVRTVDEPILMRDLANPPVVGSTVTLVRQFSLDPFLCDGFLVFSEYAQAMRAKDALGVEELLKKTRGHFGHKGTTALILESFDEPLDRKQQAGIARQIEELSEILGTPQPFLTPEYKLRMLGKLSEMKALGGDNCFKVRITSGPEKGETAFIDRNFIGSLIPTRVRAGEAGILRHELTQQVRIYDRVETYKQRLSDCIAFERKPGDGWVDTLIGGMLLDEVDTAYAKAGKLIVLPNGVGVKVLGFIEPGDHPTLSQTLAHLEILAPPKNRKKIQGTKGYALAFDVYKGDDGNAKHKRKS